MDDLKIKIEQFLREWAASTQQQLRDKISWTSNLKDNVFVNVNQQGVELNMPNYGIFVDAGRKAGKQPPLNVIYEWCRSKNIDTKAAYPIARKIGREGITAKPFIYIFDNNLDSLVNGIADVVADNIADNIKTLN